MDFTWYIILILILIGMVVGALKTSAGAGSGVLVVSIMVLFLGIPFNIARDTSIFIIVIGAFTGFVIYLKQKRCNLKLTLTLSCFTILGSFLCWIFLIFYPLSNEFLRLIFGVILIITAGSLVLKVLWEKNSDTAKGVEEFDFTNKEFKKKLKYGIPFFILSGFMSYLLGIGGGVINTPGCHIVLGLPIHTSTATSTGVMFFTALFNVIFAILYGQIDYALGLILAIGVVLGAIIGTKISYKIPKAHLSVFVAFVMLFLGIMMLLSI